MPDDTERDQILRIHCNKRGIDPDNYDAKQWAKLIEATNRCVGAELEQIVCDARFLAFAKRQEGVPTIEELIASIPAAPIADAEKENIEDIRRMCVNRARSVSRPQTKPVKKTRSITVN